MDKNLKEEENRLHCLYDTYVPVHRSHVPVTFLGGGANRLVRQHQGRVT